MNLRTQTLTLFFVTQLLGAGCNAAREQPTLCLLSDADGGADTGGGGAGSGAEQCDVDPRSTTEEGLTQCPGAVVDGAGFVLRHELPAKVEPVGILKIHIEVPCEGEDQDFEATHVDGVAVVAGVIPPGGSCGFVVSATMANSDLRCEVLPAVPCADVKALCDLEPR